MKTNLLLVALLGLLSGCRSSTRDADTSAQFSALQSPPPTTASGLQPSPQGLRPPRVYLTGAFNKTGALPWTNGMTLKDGIDAAGGFVRWADRRVILMHRDGSREQFYRRGPERTLTNNPALKPEDIIYNGGHLDVFR